MPDGLVLPDSITSRSDLQPPGLVCSWTDGGLDSAWLHVAGELDIATSPQLERALREPPLQVHLVVLDLRQLEFIDCSGVRMIVNASLRAREAGRRLVLLHGPPNVNRVFELSGMADEVEIGYTDSIDPRVGAVPGLDGDERAA